MLQITVFPHDPPPLQLSPKLVRSAVARKLGVVVDSPEGRRSFLSMQSMQLCHSMPLGGWVLSGTISVSQLIRSRPRVNVISVRANAKCSRLWCVSREPQCGLHFELSTSRVTACVQICSGEREDEGFQFTSLWDLYLCVQNLSFNLQRSQGTFLQSQRTQTSLLE